jgi:hypothetical protein
MLLFMVSKVWLHARPIWSATPQSFEHVSSLADQVITHKAALISHTGIHTPLTLLQVLPTH